MEEIILMNMPKLRQDMTEKKFTDVEIMLVDKKNPENKLTFASHKILLAFSSDFFYNLFSFGKQSHVNQNHQYSIEVIDVQIAYDIIMSFYGKEIDSTKNDNADWLYKLKTFSVNDYFCIENDITELYELDVPTEGLDILLRAVDPYDIGADRKLMQIIKNAIPLDYPMENFSKEFIDELLCLNDAFATCGDTTVKIWNANTGRLYGNFNDHTFEITDMDIIADKTLAISCDKDKAIVWNIDTCEYLHTIKYSDVINAVAFLPDGKLLLGTLNGKITCQYYDTNAEHKMFRAHSGHVMRIELSPDGKSFVTLSTDCRIKLWNSQTYVLHADIQKTMLGPKDISFSTNGKQIALSGAKIGDKIHIWKFDSEDPRCTKFKYGKQNYLVTCVSYSNDGNWFASANVIGEINVWNVHTVELVRVVYATEEISTLIFLPSSKLLVSGDVTGTVKIWNVLTGELMTNIDNAHNGPVRKIVPIDKYGKNKQHDKLNQRLEACLEKIEDSNGK